MLFAVVVALSTATTATTRAGAGGCRRGRRSGHSTEHRGGRVAEPRPVADLLGRRQHRESHGVASGAHPEEPEHHQRPDRSRAAVQRDRRGRQVQLRRVRRRVPAEGELRERGPGPAEELRREDPRRQRRQGAVRQARRQPRPRHDGDQRRHEGADHRHRHCANRRRCSARSSSTSRRATAKRLVRTTARRASCSTSATRTRSPSTVARSAGSSSSRCSATRIRS